MLVIKLWTSKMPWKYLYEAYTCLVNIKLFFSILRKHFVFTLQNFTLNLNITNNKLMLRNIYQISRNTLKKINSLLFVIRRY